MRTATHGSEETIACALHFLELSAHGQMRDMVLRLKMSARRSLLLTLKSSAVSYLGASLVVASLVPTLGWWIGLLCLPLSIAGAAYGRAWRDLSQHWEPPIVLEATSFPTHAQPEAE